MRIVRLPGVFRPSATRWLLADAVRAAAAAAGAARAGPLHRQRRARVSRRAGAAPREVTAVDVVARAARHRAAQRPAQRRARARRARRPVRGRRRRALRPRRRQPALRPGRRRTRCRRAGAERAWDAGRDGRALLDRLLDAGARPPAAGRRAARHALLDHRRATRRSSGCARAGLQRRASSPGGAGRSGRSCARARRCSRRAACSRRASARRTCSCFVGPPRGSSWLP